MNVICFREIIKRNTNLPPALLMSHSKKTKSRSIVFWAFFSERRILIFYFYLFFFFFLHVSKQRFMHKPLLRKHVFPWSPAGIARQSQDKQVPVLRLLIVSEPFGSELHTPLPFFCRVHGKYKICLFTIKHQHQIKYCRMAWARKRQGNTRVLFLPFSSPSDPRYVQRHYIWFDQTVKG